MKYLATLVLLASLLACGYNFPGQSGALPGGVTKLYIPLFSNKTVKPRLETLLSNDVSKVMSRNKELIQVASSEQAEAVLEGQVIAYSANAISYDSDDEISQFRATMTIDVVLRQLSDGRALWQGTLSWRENFLANDNKSVQNDLENEAILVISSRLADELLSRLLDDF